MAEPIADLVVELRASNDKFRSDIQQARAEVRRSSRAIQASINKTNKGIESAFSRSAQSAARFGESLRSLTAIAGGVVLGRIVQGAVAMSGTLRELNQRLPITVEALQELQFVGEQNGVSANTVTMGLQRLARRGAEAAQGTGEAADALKELGIDAAQLSRLTLDRQLEIVAQQMQEVGSQSDRVRLAFKLFDSEGVSFLQFMEDGAEGISRLREQAIATGGILSNETVQANARAGDAFTTLSTAVRGFVGTLVGESAPALEGIANFLANNLPAAASFSVQAFERMREFAAFLFAEISLNAARLAERFRAIQDFFGFEEAGRNTKLFIQSLKETENIYRGLNERLIEQHNEIGKVNIATREATVSSAVINDALKTQTKNHQSAARETDKQAAALQRLQDAAAASADRIRDMVDPIRPIAREIEEVRALSAKGLLDERTAVQAEKILLGRVSDALDQTSEGMDAFREKATEDFSEIRGAIQGFGDKMTDSLVSAATGGAESFRTMVDSILEDISRIVARKLVIDPLVDSINELVDGIGKAKSAGAGGGGGIGGFIGSIFGGGGGSGGGLGDFLSGILPKFAAGGSILGGTAAIVGEKGPELFVPGASGAIVPNNALGGVTNVNFTITANDARGFDDLLQGRKNQIIGMVQSAYARQGKRGISR